MRGPWLLPDPLGLPAALGVLVPAGASRCPDVRRISRPSLLSGRVVLGRGYGCLGTLGVLPCLRCRSAGTRDAPTALREPGRMETRLRFQAVEGRGKEREKRARCPPSRVLGKNVAPRAGARDFPPVTPGARLESAWMSLEPQSPGPEDTSPGCRAWGGGGAERSCHHHQRRLRWKECWFISCPGDRTLKAAGLRWGVGVAKIASAPPRPTDAAFETWSLLYVIYGNLRVLYGKKKPTNFGNKKFPHFVFLKATDA